MKDSPPRQRRHRRRDNNANNQNCGPGSPWKATVKNTFLEVNVDFDDDEYLSALSPAVSSPGKMETCFSNGSDVVIFSPCSSVSPRGRDSNRKTNLNSVPETEDERTVGTVDTDQSSPITTWNPYVAPFEPVMKQNGQQTYSPQRPREVQLPTRNIASNNNESSSVNAMQGPASQDWTIESGCNVILANLVANGAPFNGFWGRVENIDPETMRYSIYLDDFFPPVIAKVKECNLVIPRQ